MLVRFLEQYFSETDFLIHNKIGCLRSEDRTLRREAVRVLYELSAKDENVQRIAEAGGIEPLVSLLSDWSSEVQKYAAATLKNLAYYDEHEERIAEAGGIKKLVSLLSGLGDAKVEAAGALCRLAVNSQNKKRIADAGGIGKMIALLSDGNSAVRLQAVCTMFRLSEHAENQRLMVIRHTEGIRSLVFLLYDWDPEIRKYAAGALQHLSVHHESHKEIRSSGGY